MIRIKTSEFVDRQLSSKDHLLDDPSFHTLELSPEQFRDLSITFYPGFAERNAFLGHFHSSTSKRRRLKRGRKHQDDSAKFQIIRALSQIPVGSRLRYINHSDCEGQPYSKIMNRLGHEVTHSPSSITLQFEDVAVIQQKVQNSSGAVMAWHVKQQTLGVHLSRNLSTSIGRRHRRHCLCIDCGHITHSCVRDVVDSWYITLLVFIVILYDLSIVFYAESHRIFWEHHAFDSRSSVLEEETVVSLTVLALSLYLIEIAFRVYGYGNHFNGTPIHLLSRQLQPHRHHNHPWNEPTKRRQPPSQKDTVGHLTHSHQLSGGTPMTPMTPISPTLHGHSVCPSTTPNLSAFEHKNGGINFDQTHHRHHDQPHHPMYRRTCRCCSACRYVTGYLARGWIEFLDSLIIIVSFTFSILDIAYIRSGHIPFSSLPAIYEMLRLLRIALRIVCKLKYTPKCIRLLVSVNRQRYFDEKFDLDLCYIVYPRYLVMSWPSSGIESLYRNPLRQVAKFLNQYHDGNYLIFDLCKERSYDDMLFNGRVMRSRSMIDHSVCSLSDMFEFAQLVHLWLRHNPIHCAVIHCKGGKGRTGLMVCACLMYDYRETTVSEALEYFATMRTNYCKHGKMQGVETPSQLRYCKYFYQLIHITDILKMKQTQSAETRGNDDGNTRNGGTSSTAEVAHSEITPLAPNVRGKEHAHPDHKSISQNTRDFYKMVIAASPQRVTANGLSILEPLSQEPTRTMDGQRCFSTSKM